MAQHLGLLLVWICLPHSVPSLLDEDDTPPTVDSLIRFPEIKDGKCVFPFWYKSRIFYDCIKFTARHKWCSLNTTFEGYWKYCTPTDFAPCAFPFWYGRLIYWECTEDGEDLGKKWCSLTKNFNKDRVWKYC